MHRCVCICWCLQVKRASPHAQCQTEAGLDFSWKYYHSARPLQSFGVLTVVPLAPPVLFIRLDIARAAHTDAPKSGHINECLRLSL